MALCITSGRCHGTPQQIVQTVELDSVSIPGTGTLWRYGLLQAACYWLPDGPGYGVEPYDGDDPGYGAEPNPSYGAEPVVATQDCGPDRRQILSQERNLR